ncbi:MAG: RsmE family RNA methyltransferase [Tissierellia bacterium]|nr:RsmE family RNA methyltransferase [Tissierellia bacterium]
MIRVFEENRKREEGFLSKENRHHLKNVLRIKGNEIFQIVYQDGIFFAKWEDEFMVLGTVLENRESSITLNLCFGILKGSKNEEILEHCTEIGVTDFFPLEMDRSVADISKKVEKKKARWNKIIESAAKQSKRDRIPILHDPMTLAELKQREKGTYIVSFEDENQCFFEDIKEQLPEKLYLVIGPEGGFSSQEMELLKNDYVISLGKRILRAETAAFVSSFHIIHSLEKR